MTTHEIISASILSSIKSERQSNRIEYIRRIFSHEQELGILDKQIKRNPYYFNDTFDALYDMNYYDLEELEQNISGVVNRYKEGIFNGE